MRSPRQTFGIIRGRPSPGRFVASRLLRQARLSERVTFRVRDGLRLRLYPSHLTETYWQVRDARAEDHRILEALLTEGDTYVDVGANIGALAIHAASLVSPRGRVVALEPHPRIYGYLLGNIRLNGCANIEALNVAASAEASSMMFTNERADDLNRVAVEGIEVEAARLDDIVGDRDVTLLKVDVEGYELAVFQGATETLRRTRAVYFESSDMSRRYGHEPRSLTDLLRELGFEIMRLHSGRWVPIEKDHGAAYHEDLLAVRELASLDALTS